jgi:hypothetical protein
MEDLVQVAVCGAYNRHWDERDLLSQGFHPLFHVEHLLLCVEPLLDFLPQLQFCLPTLEGRCSNCGIRTAELGFGRMRKAESGWRMSLNADRLNLMHIPQPVPVVRS